MKRAPKRRVAGVVTLAFVACVSVGLFAQTSRTADVALKAAQHIEEVEGNLRGAIDAYAKLAQGNDRAIAAQRSEERRVGKECRSRWSPYH